LFHAPHPVHYATIAAIPLPIRQKPAGVRTKAMFLYERNAFLPYYSMQQVGIKADDELFSVTANSSYIDSTRLFRQSMRAEITASWVVSVGQWVGHMWPRHCGTSSVSQQKVPLPSHPITYDIAPHLQPSHGVASSLSRCLRGFLFSTALEPF